MTADQAARYRLRLAELSLTSARDNFSRGAFRDAALFARASVEHGAKAILACFSAVPKTHEPGKLLRLALDSAAFPAELRAHAEQLALTLDGYGIGEHILLSYGDEEHQVDPWTLVDETRARTHVATAEATIGLAQSCIAARS